MKVKKQNGVKVDSGRGKSYSAMFPWGRRRRDGAHTRALRHHKMTDANLKRYSGIDVSMMSDEDRTKARV